MDSKLFSSCLNKYRFHRTKALEEAECACEHLETIIVALMSERNIPDDKVVPFEIAEGKFIFVYTSGGHLFFRYFSNSFIEGYYDSIGFDESIHFDMICLFGLLAGKRIEEFSM